MQLKIDTVHDHIIEKECLEYLRGTLWDFLDIGIFLAHFLKGTKNKKVFKNRLKTIFPLIFIFWSIKQNWPKIQFYLLGPISVIRFVHFPIDISNYFFKKVS